MLEFFTFGRPRLYDIQDTHIGMQILEYDRRETRTICAVFVDERCQESWLQACRTKHSGRQQSVLCEVPVLWTAVAVPGQISLLPKVYGCLYQLAGSLASHRHGCTFSAHVRFVWPTACLLFDQPRKSNAMRLKFARISVQALCEYGCDNLRVFLVLFDSLLFLRSILIQRRKHTNSSYHCTLP